jgi:hypothetical protein
MTESNKITHVWVVTRGHIDDSKIVFEGAFVEQKKAISKVKCVLKERIIKENELWKIDHIEYNALEEQGDETVSIDNELECVNIKKLNLIY